MEKARNTDEINNGAVDAQANSVQGINRNGGVVEQAGATYMECRRNHAAFIGGYILDGCGKFVKGSAGMFQDQNKEASLCARCGCHRNFHWKVLPRQSPHLRGTTRYHHILNYLCNSLPLTVLQPRPPTPWLLRSKPLTSYELIEGQGSSLSPEEAEEEKSESDPGDEVDQPSKINKAG